MTGENRAPQTGGGVRIAFNDLHAQFGPIEEELRRAIADVISRADFINGRAVGEFERAFADYCGAAACAGVANGTAALQLALEAAGVAAGDEVITSPLTFIATAEAISHCGATVQFADIDPETLNLDPLELEKAISPRVRAVIFVHLHGNPTGAAECAEVARRHGLFFFEDCAQAHGARLADGTHVGSLGEAGCYSFFPAKNLGAFGDAGAVTSRNADLADRVRRLANHGRSEKYVHLEEGYNHRLDTLQAAVLKVRLAGLEDSVCERVRLAALYREQLAGLPLKFQKIQQDCRCAWHLFTIRVENRSDLDGRLKMHNIQTGIHYPVPLHLQPAYSGRGWKKGAFPGAELATEQTLSLPFYPGMPGEHVEIVSRLVREVLGGG